MVSVEKKKVVSGCKQRANRGAVMHFDGVRLKELQSGTKGKDLVYSRTLWSLVLSFPGKSNQAVE